MNKKLLVLFALLSIPFLALFVFGTFVMVALIRDSNALARQRDLNRYPDESELVYLSIGQEGIVFYESLEEATTAGHAVMAVRRTP